MRSPSSQACCWPRGLGWAQDYLSYKMLSTSQQPFHVYVDSRSNRPAGLDIGHAERRGAKLGHLEPVPAPTPRCSPWGGLGARPQSAQSHDDFSVTRCGC